MTWQIDHYISTTTQKGWSRSGVKTSVVEELAETRADRIVSTNIVQTMRAKDIKIIGERFKPNTKYFCFFDGIDVNAYMTPDSATYGIADGTAMGTALRSDSVGKVLATFSIPASDQLNFGTGRKTFKLTESSTGSDDVLSRGTAIYEANGTLREVQEVITSTRNGVVYLEELTDSKITTDTTVQHQSQRTEWVDPLAQSFLINMEGGLFVTSVELFFEAKAEHLPVTVQLRHMENGFPTQRQLPFGEKILAGSSVNISANASATTKFSFPSPVYLESGNDYCIVLLTDSNEYKVWVSEMGGQDIQTNDFIDQQPYAGSLFKSQNNSTWTPDQMRDLKMTLNRAQFTTGATSTAVFNNTTLATDSLQINPIETVSGTKTFKVKQYSHGNYDQSKSNVTIAGVTADRIGSVFSFASDTVTKSSGTVADGTYTTRAHTSRTGSGSGMLVTFVVASNVTTSLTITNPGQGYAAGNTVTFTNFAEDDATGQTNVLTLTIAAVKDTLGGIPIEYIGHTTAKIHSAGTSASGATASAKIMADIDEYLITIPDATWPVRVSTTDTTPNYQGATENVTGGGSAVTATQNAYFDLMHTVIPSIELPNTGITTTFKATTATQPVYGSAVNSYTKDTSSTTITLNDNNFLTVPKLVASEVNEDQEMNSAKSFELTCQLSSTADNVSPVIDLDTSRTDMDVIGVIAVQNRINKIDSTTDVQAGTYTAATEARGDSNAAIYMTKRVQLETPANAIHILFDGYRTPNVTTDPSIDVYYKISGPDANLQFDDMGWTLGTIKKTVQPDATAYREYLYEIEGLEDFNMFAVKMVLQSIDSANPPLIKNFRAIALGT